MYVSNNICFVCLLESDKNKLRTLFHKETEEIFAHVKYVLPELTILDSENPVGICSSCCIAFRSFYTFKKKCLENYSRWKHYTQKLPETSNIQHLTNNENEDTWLSSEVQDECEAGGEDKIVVKEESLASEENVDRELYQHFVKCETVSYEKQDGGSSVTNANNNALDKSETNSSNDSDSQELKCILCNEVFTYRLTLDIHLRNHIDNITGLECLICKKKFTKCWSVKTHMKIHIGIKDYVCSICKKKFTQGVALKTHMKIHTGIKDYECSVCEKKFVHSGNLKAHMKIHKGVKDYECKICKKKFLRNSYWRKHTKMHECVKRLINNVQFQKRNVEKAFI